jgi:molecular chaperone GrpE
MPKIIKKINLEKQLQEALEKEKRAVADYQNLIRRTQEERIKLIRMSNQDLIMSLIQPLEHLSLAAKEVNNSGLDMVIVQLWQSLSEFGLEEIEVMEKEFDVNTMEATDIEGKGKKVISVIKKGFRLNGQVIQHAKVILGD